MSFDANDLRLEEFPSDPREDFAWEIFRAEVAKPVQFICLSVRPTGVRTHFYQGRTMPCFRHNCPACRAKIFSRFTGYLAGLSAKVHRNILVEYSAGAAKDLRVILDVNKSLRGNALVLSRVGRKPNGPLRFESKGMYSGGLVLPPCPNVLEIMCKVWRIDRAADIGLPDEEDVQLSPSELGLPRVNGREVQSAAAAVSQALGDLPGQQRIEWPS